MSTEEVLAATLIPPRKLVFSVCHSETIEDRNFYLPDGMIAPALEDEVRLPLGLDDPLRDTDEWKGSDGWVLVTKRAIDYVAGHVWLQVHFINGEDVLGSAIFGTCTPPCE